MERPVELGLKEFYTEEEAAFKKNIEHSYEFTFGHPAEYHKIMLHLFPRSRRDSQSYDNDWIDDFESAASRRTIRLLDIAARRWIPIRRFESIAAALNVFRRRFVASAASSRLFQKAMGSWGQCENRRSLSILHDRRVQQGYYFTDLPNMSGTTATIHTDPVLSENSAEL
jgi:hypothetical protein